MKKEKVFQTETIYFGANTVANLNGVLSGYSFAPHSLVVLGKVSATKSATKAIECGSFNVKADCVLSKCRNTDAVSIFKALVRAYFEGEKAELKFNSQACVKASQNTVNAKTDVLMKGYAVYVTDKEGHILPKSRLEMSDGSTLRNAFSFKKSSPLVKAFFEDGLAWDDKRLSVLLVAHCKAAVEKLGFVQKLAEAVKCAANATEKDENEKKAKKEEALKVVA